MQQFAVDKALAAIYEGIAILKIEQWYLQQGKRVHARYNEANGLEHKRGFDLVDSYGTRWEVKADRLTSVTGNVFLEHQAIQHSEADMFLIFALGFTFVLPREAVLELMEGPYRSVAGGDDLRAIGTLVPIAALEELAEIV